MIYKPMFNIDWLLNHCASWDDQDGLLLVDVLLYFGHRERDVSMIGAEGWREIITKPAPGFIPLLEKLYGVWKSNTNAEMEAYSVQLAASKIKKRAKSRINEMSQPNQNEEAS